MATQQIEVRVVDKTQAALRNIDRRIQGVERSLISVNQVAGIAVTALGAIGGANLIRGVATTTARFQDLRTTLASVTGSARDGAAAFGFVSDFATRTQFGVEELSRTFISLKANGLEPTEQLLTLFTDTAAITTDQIGTLDAMTKLFSRSAAGAGVQLEELDMIAERGVPVYKILEERLGLTRGEITEFGKDSENTKVLIGALTEGLRELAGGATESRLMNLSTAMSNFSINVRNVQDAVGQGGLGTAMTGFINLLNDALVRVKPLATMIGEELGYYVFQFTEFLKGNNFEFGKFLEGAKIAIAVLGGAGLVKILQTLTSTTKALTLAMMRNPIGLLAVAAASAITYLSMENGLGKTVSQVFAVVNKLGEAFSAVGKYLNNIFSKVIEYIADMFYKFIDGVISSYNALAEWIPFLEETDATARGMAKAVGEVATDAFEAVTGAIGDAVDTVTEYISTSELVKKAQEEGASILGTLTAEWQRAGLTYEEAEQAARSSYEQYLKQNDALAATDVALGNVIEGTSEYTRETVNANKATSELAENQTKLRDGLTDMASSMNVFAMVDQLNALNDAYGDALADIYTKTKANLEKRQSLEANLNDAKKAQELKIFEDTENRKNEIYMRLLNHRLMLEAKAGQMSLSQNDKDTLQRIKQQNDLQQQVNDRIEFEKKSELEKTQFGLQQGATFFKGLAAYNKKFFAAYKAFAIAQAIVNTYQGATKALATYPPPFNFIAAAATVASGLAQVATIRAQTAQRGGTVIGGQPAVVGEDGPELIVPKQGSTVIPREVAEAIDGMGGGGGGPVTVNFNINTVDARGFDELLIERRGTITGIINNAMQQRGRMGVV